MSSVILSDVIEIISGGTPRTSEPEYWENGTIGWLSINDFNNDFRKVYNSEKRITEKGLKESSTKLLNVGDIVISARGTVGVLAQIGIPMAFNQSCFGIRGKKGIVDNTYLYYALKNYVANIKKRGQGSVFSTINLDSFKIMEINLESKYKTQEIIASVLSALDDKIELNNRINAELEQMAKTLYDYWFVQFDFPNENDEPYKLFNGKMKYDEMFKREIPEGWEVRKMKDIANTGSGGTPKSTEKRYYENGNIPWINSGELNNSFIVSTCNFITELGLNNSSAKMFPANTILMAMYGATAGKTSIIAFEATTNQAICVVMPFEKDLLYYTKFVLDDMYQYLINLSTGSARDNLSQEKIRELDIIIPQSEIIKRYSKIVSPFFDKIKNNLQQNEVLSALRDWLLPMLMNGQVKVVGDTINDDLPKGSKKEAVNKKMV